jgi:hypothetical protein
VEDGDDKYFSYIYGEILCGILSQGFKINLVYGTDK